MSEPTGKGPARGEAAHPASRRHPWRRRVLIAAAIVIVLVWMTPYLASTGPVRGYIVSKINGQIAGHVELEGLSLSWFGPCEIRGLKLRDKDGQEVLTAAKVTVDAGLLHIATSWQDLKSVDIASAHALVSVGPDGGISLVEAVGKRKAAAPTVKPPGVAPTSPGAPAGPGGWRYRAGGATR